MDTHVPLRGIEVGDLGAKIGYQGVDNGYLMFNKVKVPRTALLSRFAAIEKNGDFEIKSDPRLLYQIMSQTRLVIIIGAALGLIRAATVATRYAVCRR